MRIFGIEVTFIDRSKEQDVLLVDEYEEKLATMTSSEYHDTEDNRYKLYEEVETLRREMINRGYLDDDDSSY
jgi:hypothetical protein